MEPILDSTNKVKGMEILYFDNADIEKFKGDSSSFAASGPLSVLYFKDYNRIVLHLNDWRYPLLRRLPILATSKGDLNSRSYTLPAPNGFFFHLRINNIPSNASISNFETILNNNCNFSYEGQDTPFRKIEASPDDKLIRHMKKETGPKEVISETMKHAGEKIKIATETAKMHTKNLQSRRKKMDLKSLKNKNFRKSAQSKLKPSFFESTEKLSKEFLDKRRNNPSLMHSREWSELMKTSDLPNLYLWKEEIEESILNYKDLAGSGSVHMGPAMGMTSERREERRGGFMESLKQGLHEIKESFTGILGGKESNRDPDFLDKVKQNLSGLSTEPSMSGPSTGTERRQENLRGMGQNVPSQRQKINLSKVPGFEGVSEHYQG